MNKFVDCFLFNDELDMLEFRLTEHDSFTDYFVLIECNKTHSLKPKELYATNNIDRFDKWKDKLIIVVIDVNLIKNLQWSRLEALSTQTSGIQKARWLEDFSRECGIQKVKELYNNNLIDSNTIVSCVGDVDEIYDNEKIEELKKNITKPVRPLFYYHYYSIKITRPNNPTWTPQKRLKILKFSDLKKFTIKEIKDMIITNKSEMGWHLSYFGGVDTIANKLNSFIHFSMKSCKEAAANKELIKHRLENNIDIIGREWEKLEVVEPKKVPIHMDLLKKLKIDILLSE